MNLDELRELWRAAHEDAARECDLMDVTTDIRDRSASFDRRVRYRDMVETVAAGVVVVGMGWALFAGMPWLANLGMIVCILGCIECVVVMHWTRRMGRPSHREAAMTDFCRAELARVDRQIWLSRNVWWWYAAPIVLGIDIFFFGLIFSIPIAYYQSIPFFVALSIMLIWLGAAIQRLNTRNVLDHLTPYRGEVEEILSSLASEE